MAYVSTNDADFIVVSNNNEPGQMGIYNIYMSVVVCRKGPSSLILTIFFT